MTFKTRALSLTLACTFVATAAIGAERRDPKKAVEKPSVERTRNVRERARSGDALQAPRERRPVDRARGGGTPAQQCVTVPGPTPDSPPRTHCSGVTAEIRIERATATPDVRSGRRQLEIRVQASSGPITHWRASQGNTLEGVAWKSWPSTGRAKFSPGCPGYDRQLVLQVRGQPLPNPNLAGATKDNHSNTVKVDFELPPEIDTRIAAFGEETSPLLHPVQPEYGDASMSTVNMAYKVEIVNAPEPIEPSQVRGVAGNCFEFLGTPESLGTSLTTSGAEGIWAVGRIAPNRTSCRPSLYLYECAAGVPSVPVLANGPRTFLRSAPNAIELPGSRTVVVEDTASLLQRFDIESETGGTCEAVQNRDGDLSYQTKSGGSFEQCTTTVDWKEDTYRRITGKLYWKSTSSGVCGLGTTFVQNTVKTLIDAAIWHECVVKGICLDRQPDIRGPATPRLLEPGNLSSTWSLVRPVEIQHACAGSGDVRTWLDRAEFEVPADIEFP